MECFHVELEQLEEHCKLVIGAVESVISSTRLPVLLEGMLILGNYVNSSSRTLSAAVGVTLASLARLAHTKCVCTTEHSGNALSLLIEQLSAKHGESFANSLSADLEMCRLASEIDPKVICQSVDNLTLQTLAAQNRRDLGSGSCVPAFTPSRLDAFLKVASPRLEAVKVLVRNLDDAAVSLRKHFAELPESTLPEMLEVLASLVASLKLVKPNDEAVAVACTPRGTSKKSRTRTDGSVRKVQAARRPSQQQEGEEAALKKAALASLPQVQPGHVGNERGLTGTAGPKRRLVQLN
jgi:hypothetical protein